MTELEKFDLMAKGFDTERRIERSKIIADEIRMHIVDGHKKSAIEYGCGTGLVGLQLINDFNTLLLVDSSPGMIAQVEQKIKDLGKETTSTLCSDFMTEEPQGIRADYIFLSLVLHHIKDTQEILTRFYNLLCDKGHLLIVDLDKEDGRFHANHSGFDGHNGFEQSSLADLTLKTGFKKAEAKTFYHGIKDKKGDEASYSFFILDAVK